MAGAEIDVEFTSQLQHVISKVASQRFEVQLKDETRVLNAQIDDNYAEYIIGVTVEEVANMATQTNKSCTFRSKYLPLNLPEYYNMRQYHFLLVNPATCRIVSIETSRETFSQGTDLVDALIMPSSTPSLPTLPRKTDLPTYSAKSHCPRS
ncbi:hypothetical protein ACH5RR_003663 [Cinchona calisaya]|uniref:Uncharacterized protein n=1 Tax=Cinchona calisaya TaxID=153742 RepID=A0ABD3AVF5_9GENT